MRLPARRLGTGLALAAALLVPTKALAEIQLPPGFSVKVYVTGEGFETTGGAGGRGIPTTPTLAVDPTGALYLARGGRRYSAGEFDYLQRMYRIPPGGARLTPATEERYFHGPPLINAQVMGARGGRELLVSTFDRDRRVGVLYRLASGRIQLFAGGTPERGLPPALVQPEGAAVDAAGHVYVADRERGVVVRLDAGGNLLDAGYVRVTRPRALAFVPITAETRAGGRAGDRLVAVTRSGSFQLNDIVRISGPFTDLIQSRLGATGR